MYEEDGQVATPDFDDGGGGIRFQSYSQGRKKTGPGCYGGINESNTGEDGYCQTPLFPCLHITYRFMHMDLHLILAVFFHHDYFPYQTVAINDYANAIGIMVIIHAICCA